MINAEVIHQKRMRILHCVNDKFEELIKLPKRLPQILAFHKELREVLIENMKSDTERFGRGCSLMCQEHKDKLQKGRKNNRLERARRFKPILEIFREKKLHPKQIFMHCDSDYNTIRAIFAGKSVPNWQLLTKLEEIIKKF